MWCLFFATTPWALLTAHSIIHCRELEFAFIHFDQISQLETEEDQKLARILQHQRLHQTSLEQSASVSASQSEHPASAPKMPPKETPGNTPPPSNRSRTPTSNSSRPHTPGSKADNRPVTPQDSKPLTPGRDGKPAQQTTPAGSGEFGISSPLYFVDGDIVSTCG